MLWLMAVLTAGPAMANERLMPSEWTMGAAEYSGIACTESGGGWTYTGGVYHAARTDGAPGRPEQYFASYLALIRGSQCSAETACNSKIEWTVTQPCEVQATSSSQPSVSLTVRLTVGGTLRTYAMTYVPKRSRYELTVDNLAQPNPAQVTVTSSGGGSATGPISVSG